MNIPYNWEEAPLENLLIHVIGGDWGKAINSVEDIDEFVQVSCIRGAEFRHWDTTKGNSASLRLIKKNSLTNRKLQPNDILLEISGGGPEQPVGRTVLIDNTCLSQNPNTPKVCTNFLRLIRPSSIFNSRYLNYYLKYFYFTGEVTKYQAGSNNLRNLKFKNYVGIIIPIPSLKEQHRIVNKIETLFSKLDKGIESLKTAQEQLKLYRQALLKHAFEGKLTEQWRKDNADKLESAEELLTRIKQERENRYQQQSQDWGKAVEQWEAEGKDGKKPVKPKKLTDLNLFTKDDFASLPETPFGWCWIKYGDLCSIVRNGISKKPIGEIGDKIFRISAVRPMFFNMEDYRILENKDGEYDHFHLLKGDLVFTRYNGTRKYVGVCAEYKSDEKILFPDKLVQTRADLPTLSSSFLEKALNSGASRKFVDSKIRTTAGQSGVSGGDIKNIPIAICSKQEQILISTYSEEKLSVIDQLEKEIAANLKKSQALRQSILKKAFSGKLVPQDPNDEPASELLKRIAIEKAELVSKTKASVKKTKSRLKSKQASSSSA